MFGHRFGVAMASLVPAFFAGVRPDAVPDKSDSEYFQRPESMQLHDQCRKLGGQSSLTPFGLADVRSVAR